MRFGTGARGMSFAHELVTRDRFDPRLPASTLLTIHDYPGSPVPPLRKAHSMNELTVIAGAGDIGHLVVARAAQPTYDKLASTIGRMAKSGGLDEAADRVVTAGVDLWDAEVQRAADKVKGLSSRAATQLANVADSARHRVERPEVQY